MQKHEQGAEESATGPTLQSRDLLSGLGASPRDLVATCLALFEDSTLQQRIRERLEGIRDKLRQTPERARDSLPSLQRRIMEHMHSAASDQELRLLLWIRLREAFGLPPSTFGALRAAKTAADDLVAATLAFVQPGMFDKAKRAVGRGDKREIPATLDALARQTVQELMEGVLRSDDEANAEARSALLQGAREQIERLPPEAQERLLRAINSRQLNDEAIRTLLLTGGGLTAFGSAVGLAGFSAYILAAQVSAFIPLISGPALVSFVAVLADPITIGLATLGVGVWATRSANQKIQAAIAMRVIALLALVGMTSKEVGLRALVQAFRLLPEMKPVKGIPPEILTGYQTAWKEIAPAHRTSRQLEPALAVAVDRPPPGKTLPDRWKRLFGHESLQDIGILSALTVGELLYLVHSLEPEVLAAANFSRLEDLNDPVAFAVFAHRIDEMDAAAKLGAMSNLKGYVAEQVVAAKLADQGHVVEFPPTSNQAGWDLSVDGIKFQVKNTADLELLERHFRQGHEYPVLANAEVAALLEQARADARLPDWADQVHFVEGYSGEAVQEVTAATLDAGDSLLHPHVPVFAVLLGAARNVDRFAKGQMTGTQALQDALINGSIRAGLAVAGNYAGVGIGLLVFGPAGALVLGSTLPLLSRAMSSRAKDGLDKLTRGERYRRWEQLARTSLESLYDVLRASLNRKAELITSRPQPSAGAAGEYLRWRQDDDLRYLREIRKRLEQICTDARLPVEVIGERLLVWLSTSTVHPAVYQKQLTAWLEVFGQRPDIAQNLGDGVRNVAGKTETVANTLKQYWESISHRDRPH